ncbi:MAG TPA: RNHCP domain-containing protein [Candidatus Paceibacterota bacterium]|nr:RNHCP domain-containing protein [Candidatus Paceibacterota bacterium]HRZ34259.1 RNHCP domain-containing protein [Candidatus Paceibacterota bacterium]
MFGKLFQKKKEDFICEKCGFQNQGDGYTNHCQKCLWSKHVDVNPGDRAESCRGLMKPVDLVNEGGVFYILHRCVKCGAEKRNKAQKGDDFKELINLSRKY